MRAMDFLAKARSLESRPVAVIYGDEAYLRQQVRGVVQRLAIGESDPGLCLREFQGNRVDTSEVLDELATPLLFAPRGLVVVEGADPLVSAHRALFERYATKPNANSVLLLMVHKWPGNTRLAKIVARSGYAVDCASPGEREILDWCGRYARREHGKALPRDAAHLLVELVGTDMGRLASQVDKLAAYVGQADRIAEDDVDVLVGRQRVRSTWELMDAAAQGEPTRALSILERLLASGEAPVAIVGAVGWQLRRMVQATHLLDQQTQPGQVCRTVGVPPFAADRFLRQIQSLGTERIRHAYRMLLDIDLGLKGASDVPARALLERLLVCLCC